MWQQKGTKTVPRNHFSVTYLTWRVFRAPKPLPDRILHRKMLFKLCSKTSTKLFFFSSTASLHFFRTPHHGGSELLRGSQECGRIASEHGCPQGKVATNTAPRYCLSIPRSDGDRNDRKLAKFAFGKIKDQVVYKHI